MQRVDCYYIYLHIRLFAFTDIVLYQMLLSGAMTESKDDNLRASRGEGDRDRERDNQEQQVNPQIPITHTLPRLFLKCVILDKIFMFNLRFLCLF